MYIKGKKFTVSHDQWCRPPEFEPKDSEEESSRFPGGETATKAKPALKAPPQFAMRELDPWNVYGAGWPVPTQRTGSGGGTVRVLGAPVPTPSDPNATTV